jgi:hypothetical protein
MEADRNAFSEVFMIPLSTALSRGFTFTSKWRGFELKQNDQTVATLRSASIWCSSFEASTSSENWIIRRSGFWGNRAEIVDASSEQPIATFKSAWGGRHAGFYRWPDLSLGSARILATDVDGQL